MKGSELDGMYWTEPWKDPEFGLILDSRSCFATINLGANWKKKKRCFFGQKHPSGFGSGVSVVLGSIPKLQWMPHIRAHLSSTNWTWLLIKTKQNNWPRPPKQAPKPKRREFEDGRETWLLGAKDSEGKRGRTDSHFIHSFISSTLKRKEERNDFWRGGSE